MYVPYNPNPCGLSTGDCTVRAISKALDISWDEAHDILSEFSKNMCDLPHKDWVWGAVLRANGFRRVIVPDTTPIDYSAADFAEDNPRGIYVLGFGGHQMRNQYMSGLGRRKDDRRPGYKETYLDSFC